MVKLEIRNLDSSKSHLVDPGGAVLGREGGDAQIKLADQGVSKKHARIYAKRGTWYLEDLDSANGTYLEDERITSPVVLTPGSVFTMSRQQFEVVQIVTEEPEPTRAPRQGGDGDDMDHAETNAMEPGDLPDRLRAAKGGKRPAGKSSGDLRGRQQRVEDDDPLPTDHSTSARARDAEPDQDDDRDEPPARGRGVQSASRSRPEDSDVPAPSFAYFATAIPRAVAYYLKSVPLMAVNPLGTIRKGIAEQPLPALSNVELIAYAFPALLFTGLVSAVCGAILAIVSHTFSVTMLFPVFPLVSAAVGAIVAGFLCHPVLTWVVDKLEGQSDARSRSNMFVMQMTASALLAVPGGLAVLLGLVRLPFINLLPLLLSVAASLVVLFLLFSWFRYFGVVQWFEYVVLGLGALLVLNAAYGLVTTTINSFRGGGVSPGAVATGPAPVVGVPGEPPEVTALRQKVAEAAAAGDQAAVERLSRELAEKLTRGAAAQRTGTGSAPVAADPASKQPDEDPPPPATPPVATANPGSTAPTPAVEPAGPAATAPPPPAAAPPTASAPPPPATPAVATDPPPPSGARAGKPSFPEYRSVRTAVEKAIADDPTLLRRAEILKLYREMVTETRLAEDRFRPTEKGPAAALINSRLKEADVYDRTWKPVMELNRQLFR